MGEINLDESKVLIDIKETCIEFQISESQLNVPSNYETSITIDNLVDVNVGVRIKTTKKEIYAVTPSYLLMTPNSRNEIRVAYTRRCDSNDNDIGKHKFKFEAILVEPDITQDDLKNHFTKLSNSKTKVQGTILKKRVYHKIISTATGTDIKIQSQDQSQKNNSIQYQSLIDNQSMFQSVRNVELNQSLQESVYLNNSNLNKNPKVNENPTINEELLRKYHDSSIYLMELKNELKIKSSEFDILKAGLSQNSNQSKSLLAFKIYIFRSK